MSAGTRSKHKKRPVLILKRNSAIAVLHSVTVAPITSTIRSIPTEVVLTEADGLPTTCAANFDNPQTVPKNNIGERIIRLISPLRWNTCGASLPPAVAP